MARAQGATFSEFVQAAISLARYERDEESEVWCAFLHELPFCWAQGDTVEEARATLREVVEDWLVLSLEQGDPIPILSGLRLGSRLKGKSLKRRPERARVPAGAAR